MNMINDLLMFFGLSSTLAHADSYLNIITGLLNGFFGYKLLNLWKIICGFILGCGIGYFAGISLASTTYVWAITIASGIIVAALSHFIFDLGIFIFGFLMTLSMFHTLSQTFGIKDGLFYVWMGIGLICSILLGSLASHFEKSYFILFTAIRGAISMTSGIAVLAGWNDFLRLVGLCVLLIMAGIGFQILFTRNDD